MAGINEKIYQDYVDAFPEDFFPWGSPEEWFWAEYGLDVEEARLYQMEKTRRDTEELADLESRKALKVSQLVEELQKYPPDTEVCTVWANAAYLVGIEKVALDSVDPPRYNHYDRRGKGREVLVLTGR